MLEINLINLINQLLLPPLEEIVFVLPPAEDGVFVEEGVGGGQGSAGIGAALVVDVDSAVFDVFAGAAFGGGDTGVYQELHEVYFGSAV
jgi:hypothetical protein